MIRLKQVAQLTIALLVALSSNSQGQAQSVPTVLPTANDSIVFNAPPPPPSSGRPGKRSDAGSRSCDDESPNASESKPLLALVPIHKTTSSTVVFGKTAAERPTFWFYVPQRSSSTATFVLQDQDDKPLYQSDIALPKTAGILRVTLPATVAPLSTGQRYHWFFKLYCRSMSSPSFVDGWIQREALTPDLVQKLKITTLSQQVRLYAANGFWFEALTTAAELRRTNSGDTAWAELLKAIGLESVATEAIATP